MEGLLVVGRGGSSGVVDGAVIVKISPYRTIATLCHGPLPVPSACWKILSFFDFGDLCT
jgi:hypothetical protein